MGGSWWCGGGVPVEQRSKQRGDTYPPLSLSTPPSSTPHSQSPSIFSLSTSLTSLSVPTFSLPSQLRRGPSSHAPLLRPPSSSIPFCTRAIFLLARGARMRKRICACGGTHHAVGSPRAPCVCVRSSCSRAARAWRGARLCMWARRRRQPRRLRPRRSEWRCLCQAAAAALRLLEGGASHAPPPRRPECGAVRARSLVT